MSAFCQYAINIDISLNKHSLMHITFTVYIFSLYFSGTCPTIVVSSDLTQIPVKVISTSSCPNFIPSVSLGPFVCRAGRYFKNLTICTSFLAIWTQKGTIVANDLNVFPVVFSLSLWLKQAPTTLVRNQCFLNLLSIQA